MESLATSGLVPQLGLLAALHGLLSGLFEPRRGLLPLWLLLEPLLRLPLWMLLEALLWLLLALRLELLLGRLSPPPLLRSIEGSVWLRFL